MRKLQRYKLAITHIPEAADRQLDRYMNYDKLWLGSSTKWGIATCMLFKLSEIAD